MGFSENWPQRVVDYKRNEDDACPTQPEARARAEWDMVRLKSMGRVLMELAYLAIPVESGETGDYEGIRIELSDPGEGELIVTSFGNVDETDFDIDGKIISGGFGLTM